jgi:hypothetical protein
MGGVFDNIFAHTTRDPQLTTNHLQFSFLFFVTYILSPVLSPLSPVSPTPPSVFCFPSSVLRLFVWGVFVPLR